MAKVILGREALKAIAEVADLSKLKLATIDFDLYDVAILKIELVLTGEHLKKISEAIDAGHNSSEMNCKEFAYEQIKIKFNRLVEDMRSMRSILSGIDETQEVADMKDVICNGIG